MMLIMQESQFTISNVIDSKSKTHGDILLFNLIYVEFENITQY